MLLRSASQNSLRTIGPMLKRDLMSSDSDCEVEATSAASQPGKPVVLKYNDPILDEEVRICMAV